MDEPVPSKERAGACAVQSPELRGKEEPRETAVNRHTHTAMWEVEVLMHVPGNASLVAVCSRGETCPQSRVNLADHDDMVSSWADIS